MRITGLGAKGFLSFGRFEWRTLDPHLNIIVGPNGAGKTNLFRVVRAVADALDFNVRTRWQRAIQSGGDSFRVWLDLELVGDWERALLGAFLRAALCGQQEFQQVPSQNPSQDDLRQVRPECWVQYVQHALGPDGVSWLFRGRLAAEYESGTWRVWYESLPDERAKRFRWQIDGFGGSGISAAEDPRGSTSLLAAVMNNLSDEQRAALLEYLRGSTASPPPLKLLDILGRISPQAISLEVRCPPSDWPLAAHRQFENQAGVRLESSRYYDGRFLFEQLLRRALVFTENVRRSPRLTFPLDELQTLAPIDLSDGQNVALVMFRQKNGDRDQCARYQQSQEMFNRLTGDECDFDVGLSAQASGQTPNSKVSLDLRAVRDSREIPIEFAGAGIAEALFLSAIIAGTDGRVLLLDEPALNLHPSAQAGLLKAIDAQSLNQFLVITHSPYMVRPESISRVSRFALEGGETRRWALDPAKLDCQQRQKMEKELRGSTDVRALPFSSGVILTEGETELGALPVWDEKAFEQPFEHSNVAILSVGGHYKFETYLRFAHALGVRWAVVCDGKVIGPSSTVKEKESIAQQMKRAGAIASDALSGYDQLDFAQRRAVLEDHGVFTVATAPDKGEAIESLADLEVVKKNWDAAKQEVGDSVVRIARWIAENHPCPKEVAVLLEKVRSRLRLLAERRAPTPPEDAGPRRDAGGGAESVTAPGS